MDDEFAEAVAGAMAAHGFILENLYALLLVGDADPVGACRATAQTMLRDFGNLRATGVQAMSADEVDRQHGHEDREAREGHDPPGAQHELARLR